MGPDVLSPLLALSLEWNRLSPSACDLLGLHGMPLEMLDNFRNRKLEVCCLKYLGCVYERGESVLPQKSVCVDAPRPTCRQPG